MSVQLNNVTNLIEFKEQFPKFACDFVAYAILVRIDNTQHKYPKHIREEVDQVKEETIPAVDSEIFVLKLNKVNKWFKQFLRSFKILNFIRKGTKRLGNQ